MIMAIINTKRIKNEVLMSLVFIL